MSIHNCLLEYLDNEDNVEEHFQNIQVIFEEQKIKENKHELKSVLHLILKIGNDYHCGSIFFPKIDKIFLFQRKYTKIFYKCRIIHHFQEQQTNSLIFN